MKKTFLGAFALLMTCSVWAIDPPTMGWSSWNTFALNINEQLIKSQADAMVKTGLADAGYKYINIDDGYWNGRGDDGHLRLNTKLFPNGMRNLTDYIHSIGLKAGIYSDAGDNTCGSGNRHAWGIGVGFAGHEDQDCKLYFDDWNFDFIKVDYCGGIHMGLNEREQYTKVSNAIKRQAERLNKRIVFNVCRWAYPGTWISEVADSWRTTGDIWCSWGSVKALIKENLYIQAYTGGGHYNDIDMLEIGRTLKPEEEVTHMAYWCITSSPLLIGCDMTTIPEFSLNLLKNRELLAMNQDRLGLGAPVVQRDGDVYVVAKDMEKIHGKKRAVVVVNLSDREQHIALDINKIGFTKGVVMHDCIGGDDTKVVADRFMVDIPAHGSRAFFAIGKRVEQTVYEAEEAWLKEYQEIASKQTARPVTTREDATSGGAYVGFLGNNADNYLEWRNVYSETGGTYSATVRYASGETRQMEISANGGAAEKMQGLNSGSFGKWVDAQPVTLKLKKGLNTIRIANGSAFAPDIDCITLKKVSK